MKNEKKDWPLTDFEKKTAENNERLQEVNYIKIRMTKYHQAANNSNNNTNENELVKAQQFICIKCIFLFVLLTMYVCAHVCVCLNCKAMYCERVIPKALKFVFN